MHALEDHSRFRAVVDTAVDGVILINAEGVILMFNPACERLFEYAAHEVIGRNVKMLMPEPYCSGHDGYIANYLRTGERKIIGIGREVLGRKRSGATFPLDLSVGEAEEDGRPIFVGIIRDLTERKAAEMAQAQKMETVGQLSGGIAHDFNNLLTVILGHAEALSMRLKDQPDLLRMSDTIIGAAEHGAELTRRLLAFSRRQRLQPDVIDCNDLLRSMVLLLRGTLREDVELRVSTEPDPVLALADATQLESAVLNLALNAQDAMPDGGALTLASSEVELHRGSLGSNIDVKPGRYAMISVVDEGSGMPPHVRERAFEPFFTTKEVGKGSGLGLSMVYGFVRQSGGHVTIHSEPGLGASVRLFLPVATEAAKPPSKRAPETPSAGGHEIVLVAEDDPFVRGHAIASLQDFGYRVLVAPNGREALRLIAGGARPDLLFTDIVMPGGVSGWELAARARELLPGLKVLFTSGYPLESLASRGHVDRQAKLLAKPYRVAELARRVRETLNAPA